ncbi:uncharacterized protein EAF02_003465 [Botrytis sinoallii]|uniref:uncharacterized protein n=1 Tax=Botrytis sinoallii TaxID=1463999 RepID=UPI0019004D5C|nr:uncharacterized protein EAF02_003465 [Botrytis sinoallii]KAF7886818.1 hypothetical protein EAF02_003465 [Botrytis sinoallii]
MEDHSPPLPIRAKDTQSVVQNALSKQDIDFRAAADVHSDQKIFDGAGSPEPLSHNVRIEPAAVFNDVASQSQLPLRHDNKEQQNSNRGTRINPDKLGMSAAGSIDSQRSPKKKPNGRVLICDILGPDGTPWMPKLGRCRRKKLRARSLAKVKEQMALEEQRAAEKERKYSEIKDAL